MLWLLTLLILFIATWFALFFSKQVTIPIQRWRTPRTRWRKATWASRFRRERDDELGVLVHSFNQMTPTTSRKSERH